MTKAEFLKMRAAYPHPVALRHEWVRPNPYCVGGAYLAYRQQGTLNKSKTASFPNKEELAEALREDNPKLDFYQSTELAGTIIIHNELRDFETAWNVLFQALGIAED